MNALAHKTSWGFDNKSINYIDFDVLKSGLQKSIRRCQIRDALWYAVELDSYSIYGKEGEKYRTNMINRIKVIMLEDCFNPKLVLTIGTWIRYWENCRKKEKAKKVLLNIVYHLASSPKCRLLDEYNFYHKIDYIKKHFGEEFNDLFTSIHEWDKDTSNIIKFIKQEEHTNKDLVIKASRFYYLINKKDPACFFWLHSLLEESTNSKRYKRKGVEWLAWELLFNLSNSKASFFNNFTKEQIYRKKMLKLLFYFRKTNIREHHLFLHYAIHLFIQEDLICWSLEYNNDEIKTEKINTLYAYNSNKKKFVIKDYIYDRHTQIGRRMGRGFMHFCKISSVIKNPDPVFYNQRLRDLFIKLNKNRDKF
tara:strand:+ start:1237 stop:2328 length:1092 start_codon:yes stop_codon:yes gene_type:complete